MDKFLGNNLDKLRNHMASGSYFPPAVRRAEIPKANGGIRPLGIPTVGDRVAQMMIKENLEPGEELVNRNWRARRAIAARGRGHRNLDRTEMIENQSPLGEVAAMAMKDM
ncbi:hypothetical protein AAFG07_32625 [Bradyrhizobium sp. B097]|uniref:hypothetical protein n=1 Tax=Bradyrhizobium sp. B097 TaxID=3140244 RepID=UPI003183AF02